MLMTTAFLFAIAAGQTPPPDEVPFHVAETAIIVDTLVNGRKASLIFDTGFGGAVVVDESMEIGKITGTQTLMDFVRPLQVSTVKLKSLKVGTHALPLTDDMEAVLGPWREETSSYNTHVDGILGIEGMIGQVTEINFQKHEFIFHPKSFDISKMVPDNKKTFLLTMLPLGMNSIELEAEGANGKKMTLSLDTGNSFFATTYKETLERIGAWEVGKKPKYVGESGVASGAVNSWTKKLTDMKVFGVPVPVSYWDIIDLPSSGARSDGTVGFGFLSNFNIIFDFDRRRVWLENFTGKTGNVEPGDIGLRFYQQEQGRRLTVYEAESGSPADKVGIKKGDQILAIDGKDLSSVIGLRELRRRLQGPVGSKVKLDISRDGNPMSFELERVGLMNE